LFIMAQLAGWSPSDRWLIASHSLASCQLVVVEKLRAD